MTRFSRLGLTFITMVAVPAFGALGTAASAHAADGPSDTALTVTIPSVTAKVKAPVYRLEPDGPIEVKRPAYHVVGAPLEVRAGTCQGPACELPQQPDALK
ncbi:hypothetical protein [Streptomyces europaeiscabiei]|uniref:hypothetical protein n=1 Tax=Streptomyces europaeiscabiei TaxID=146819 RepID=UPI0029BA0252|nr:hypothetical protein [Streptomyces europaeiscabiei]MDX3841741.1 hypothetical protein [Streptomyces europaeiscabiei]